LKQGLLMIRLLIISALVLLSLDSAAATKKRPPEPPRIYKDSVKDSLHEVSADQLSQKIFPFTDAEVKTANGALVRKDEFYHSPKTKLAITNETIKVNPSPSKFGEIPMIKLGHNFTTTLVFVDKEGKPWSVDLLTDVSDPEAFSVVKKAPHIITVRGLKMAGEANLPLLLKGEQYPIIFHFKISTDSAYFVVDIRANGYGDNSQGVQAVSKYNNGSGVLPRYDSSSESRDMLLGLTPKGYEKHTMFDEYGIEVDPNDFTVWSNKTNIFILTPHSTYQPQPTDIEVSPDGINKLFTLNKLPKVYLRKQNKIIYYLIK